MDDIHLSTQDELLGEGEGTEKRPRRRWGRLIFSVLILSLAATLVLLYLFSRAPTHEAAHTVTIEPGASIAAITKLMEAEGVVRSDKMLYLILLSLHRNETIEAGRFTFTEPYSAFTVARILTEESAAAELLSVTFPEGLSVKRFAAIAEETLPELSGGDFLGLASSSEGLLWPDTYFVPPAFTAAELVALMQESHTAVVEELYLHASTSLSQYEAVILASIVEREANDPESMGMVAGILQNRLLVGMALQADATLEYVTESPLGELPPGELAEQLRELDSPYNTYLYPGLPPTPIGNPGRDALMAVLNPTASDYFFYLTDEEGTFHYATTFAEHQRNIDMYLR